MAGGKPWKIPELNDIFSAAKKKNLKIHVDGARIFNAAVALGVPVSELVKGADSVMFCLSKGLACPIGSMIAGSQDFIDKALRTRKMLGGGMRQVGIIAAPGIVALDSMINRLADDHKNAQLLKKGLEEINGITTQDCETNILFVDISGLKITGKQFNNIITSSRWDTVFRFVTHYGIEKEHIEYILETLHKLYG